MIPSPFVPSVEVRNHILSPPCELKTELCAASGSDLHFPFGTACGPRSEYKCRSSFVCLLKVLHLALRDVVVSGDA